MQISENVIKKINHSIDKHAKNLEIVFVDDEEKSCKLLDRYFTKIIKPDFRLNVFFNPEVALDYIHANTDRVAVVISDVVMPTINGLDLLKIVNDDTPQVFKILTSVYDRTYLVGQYPQSIDTSDFPIVRKPWDLNLLKKFMDRGIQYYTYRTDKILRKEKEMLNEYQFLNMTNFDG